MSILKYNNLEIEYKINDKNMAIVNSYKIKQKADMMNILYMIMNQESKVWPVFARSVTGMVKEWRSHNILYDLHIFRSHTQTVDLEADQKWYFKIIWSILGSF